MKVRWLTVAKSVIKADFGVNNKKRIIYIASGTSNSPTDIANDILNAVGTLPSNMMIEGLHNKTGLRYFSGFLYSSKLYGSFIVQENDGRSYLMNINNSVISTHTITTS